MQATQEVQTQRHIDIPSVLNDRRAAIVADLPDWMKRDNAHVRYAGHEIQFDEATLPRLDGIIGAAQAFRPERRVAYSPVPETAPAQVPFVGLLALLAPPAIGAWALGRRYGVKGVALGLGLGVTGDGAWVGLSTCGPNGVETAQAPVIETAIPATATVEALLNPVLDLESIPVAMYPWQIVPADLTGNGTPLIYGSTSMYKFENGNMGIFHPLTDGSTLDTSRSYALGITSFFNATETVLTPTLLDQQGSSAVEAGMLQKIGHPDETTWEYRILKMDIVDSLGTKTLSEDQYVLVQRQTENGYTFALRDANGIETQLALDMGINAEPTALPPTQVPNNIYADVFNTPDTQLVSFKPGTSVVTVSTEIPIPTEAPTAVPATPTEAVPQERDTFSENGYTYTRTVVRDAEKKEILTGDYRPLAVKIPFLDWYGGWAQKDGTTRVGNDVAMITVYAENGAVDLIKAITHTQKSNIDEYNDYIGFVTGAFYEDFGRGADYRDFNAAIQDGKIGYPIKYGSIDKGIWYPSPEHGTIVYMPKYNEEIMTPENGYLKWTNMPDKHEFFSKFVKIDEKGNAVWIMSSKETPSSNELAMMMLYPSAAMIDFVGQDLSTTGGFSPLVHQLTRTQGETSLPYYDIQSK